MSYGPPPPGGGYGQPAYDAPIVPPKTSPLAVVSLVMGILGVIPCCSSYFIASVAAVITGVIGRRQIADSAGALKGDGLAKWGFILGIVGAVIGAVLWILVLTGVIDVSTTTRA